MSVTVIIVIGCAAGIAASLKCMKHTRDRDKKVEWLLAAGSFACVAFISCYIAILTKLNG